MDMLDEAAEKPKDDADVRVGRRVRALRLERNLSLAELAAKAGVSIGALSQIERGMSSLRVKVIWPLAAALDIEPSALIADGNDAVNDLYCVRAGSRRQIPVKSEGIAKALLSPPAATLTAVPPQRSLPARAVAREASLPRQSRPATSSGATT